MPQYKTKWSYTVSCEVCFGLHIQSKDTEVFTKEM